LPKNNIETLLIRCQAEVADEFRIICTEKSLFFGELLKELLEVYKKQGSDSE